MNDNGDKKVKELLEKLKKESESLEYPGFKNRRRTFLAQVFVSKWFWIIVAILLCVIVVLSQGIRF